MHLKKWTVFVCLLFLVRQAGAQTGSVITGFLQERASGSPVEWATVVLFDAASRKAVTMCRSDSTGHYRFVPMPAGRYYVTATLVGFQPASSPEFTVVKGKETVLDTLLLTDTGWLREAVVQGRPSTFVTRLDRKVYHVGQDVMSTSGSASDLLQNVPTVEVDMDGTVSLRGSEDVTILINGKPSAMMEGKARGDALNQLAASDIERIEVMTNPSAGFRPDGTNGIINIILKKENAEGVNGTLNGNLGSSGRRNAGLNLNCGTGKFHFLGGYTYRRDRYDRTTDDRRLTPENYTHQITTGLGRPNSHTVRLGMNVDLTGHDVLEMSGIYGHRRFRRTENIESTTHEGDLLTDFYLRDRDALAGENQWEGALRYTHTGRHGNEWGIDYSCSAETERETNFYATLTRDDDLKNTEDVWDANYLHTGKLYGCLHWSEKLKLTTGYDLEFLRARQNFAVSNWDGAAYVPDASRTSDFLHKRAIHSLYATLDFSVGDWGLLAGLRGEIMRMTNLFVLQGGETRRHFCNIYPTLHLSRHITPKQDVLLNYSLRVNRPKGSDMNPFTEYINPLSLQAGNPNLEPEKIHSIEGGWMWQGGQGMSLSGTLYYRLLTHQITEVSRLQENGVLLTTKENLNKSQSAGVELIWNCTWGKWLSFVWNVNGYFQQIDATRLGYGKNRNTFSWSTLLNANFTPINHFLIQLNVRLRGATLVPQGRRNADSRINLGAKYDIPRLGLALSASVTDLLDTYRKSYTLDTPALKQKLEKRRNPRIFYVGVTWYFGAGKHKKHADTLEYDEGM